MNLRRRLPILAAAVMLVIAVGCSNNNAEVERLRKEVEGLKAATPVATTTTQLSTATPTAPSVVAATATAQTSQEARPVARLAAAFPMVDVWRFGAAGYQLPDTLNGIVRMTTQEGQLPHSPSVVIGTTAKWSLTNMHAPFDLLMVDEAWQMSWADFMLLGQVSGRFVLIGDPGQIEPVVTVPVERWETSPRAPHRAAPDVILDDPSLKPLTLDLPVCYRLPHDSVDLVREFYDFDFEPWAEPGERALTPTKNVRGAARVLLDRLSESSIALVTVTTPPSGPPVEDDQEIAAAAAAVVHQLLAGECDVTIDDSGKVARLSPESIGITATHRMMNTALSRALPAKLRDRVRIDTPERWQGLQRPVMLVVHPLSGVVRPSAFDLATGRLCVMASRHQSALIVLSRDHVGGTLDGYIPGAEQALGRPDVVGRGHYQHVNFWTALRDRAVQWTS